MGHPSLTIIVAITRKLKFGFRLCVFLFLEWPTTGIIDMKTD